MTGFALYLLYTAGLVVKCMKRQLFCLTELQPERRLIISFAGPGCTLVLAVLHTHRAPVLALIAVLTLSSLPLTFYLVGLYYRVNIYR